ncbi:MAG: flagellar basal body rod protein FlgC [Burkholderiales bacterium]|nr:flagellar basal body rod protein FlgC [Burkholderiales bacterium]
MSLFRIFDVSGSGVAAQSQRLNVVASNLANVDSAAGPDGKPYRARHVVFESAPLAGAPGAAPATGVRVTGVVEDASPLRRVHDPASPLADREGYVTLPNVNPVEEMVDMISASRAYQTNIEMMNTAKALLLKALTLGS